ncbi:putative carbohydrate esterase, partial [Drosera capensis]
MERLIELLRSNLGLPELPFIQVVIASGDKKCIDEVRKAQLGINLPNVVCVDAKGLPLNSDHLHLTSEAQSVELLKANAKFLSHGSAKTGRGLARLSRSKKELPIEEQGCSIADLYVLCP